MPRVLIPLAQSCEELEAVTIIDILRRAGIEVTSASLDDRPITASRGVRLVPDTTLQDVASQSPPINYDMIVLPGGLPGADYLNQDKRLHQLLKKQSKENKYVAAICAVPKVLASAGLLDGRAATAYPGTLEPLGLNQTRITKEAVLIDGNIITSRGPGTAMDFALTLVELLLDKPTRNEIEAGLVR